MTGSGVSAVGDVGTTASAAPTPGHADERWFWWAVGAAVAVALVLRIAWSVYAAHTPQGLYDPARYLAAAREVAAGHGYVEALTGKPTAYYPPGYPWALGIVTWAAQHNPLIKNPVDLMAYLQSLLGAATVGAVGVIGRRLWSPAAGVLAAVLVAVYPNLIFHTAAMLSETLCIALLCGALAVLWWRPGRAAPSTRRLWCFAVLFALGVMVRPISLPVLVVVLVLWWFELRDRRQVLRCGAVCVGVLVVVIGAWTIRNAARLHAFVPISTNTGDNLCIGHGPGATGGFRFGADCLARPNVMDGPTGEVAHDKRARSDALHWIGGHLGEEPELTWKRLYAMFEHDHDGLLGVTSYRSAQWMPSSTFDAWARPADDYGAIVLGLGIVGAAVLATRRRGRALVAITVVLLAVPLAFFGDARFKVPAMPFVAIAAAVAVAAALEAFGRVRTARVPAGDQVTPKR